ncbi:MAG: ribosome biogenesis GTP-binding protein YihA/YsxC [Bacteroidales bacterium]|nr:ribosome biogenesis GTP-binding protein YihA/YsxC [Bacteroidales bacterium]MDY5193379.1 ribosome biogenesis GTP-binding protein YihA/YsxC [Candidatus Aphodosoma sp.]
MKINFAEFVVSNSDYKSCPNSKICEFAFIGRSNVGKSSLINMLLQSKDLAKTSSKPGKTLLINHFLVNRNWYVVDLPGYGYARASKEQRRKLKAIIDNYILFRTQLTNLFVLIDSRLEPQQIDLDFIDWLGQSSIPFSIIFTKSDKLSNKQLSENITAYKNKLLETWESLPPIFITSSEKGVGRDEVLDYIESIIKEISESDAQ